MNHTDWERLGRASSLKIEMVLVCGRVDETGFIETSTTAVFVTVSSATTIF